MSLADDLYRDIILEHFKNPRNHGRLEKPDFRAQGANPFCGDELELTAAVRGDILQDLKFEGKGCSISQSSASMMTEAVKGKSFAETKEIIGSFKKLMLESKPMEFPGELEDLEALEGIKKYPVRIKCAILAWNTLLDGILARERGENQASHVEGEEGMKSDTDRFPAHEVSAGAQPIRSSSSKEEEVRAALTRVIDPELNMNVVDLGLIYGIEIHDGSVKIIYTLTSPGCPLGPVIKGQVQGVVGRLPWVNEVQPELVWSPPWDPKTMASEEAKAELGIW